MRYRTAVARRRVARGRETEMQERTTIVEDDETTTDELAGDDLLVEEVSIDGMCGVY